MVRAWFVDEDPKDPRAEHHRIPPKFVSLEELYRTTGVEYFQVDPKNFQLDNTFRKLIEERGNQGIQDIDDLDPNDLKVLYVEHFHTYDEFRICLEGCGYYDIRDKFDEWIRVEILPGDLLVIPGGCYHRFTVDKNGNYRGVRILKDGVYQAHIRPSDQLRCRKEYVKKLYNGAYENRYSREEEEGVKIFDAAEQNAKA
ncbi:unnamed protein product [Callosobruchus maculatus]|uniref:acireductone dioxygenase (Fe(2+)-requiring) n=1 Tax=Callosobruchus maculatus TaxID=64391 RepID=A0A653DPU4_CALMS|nr:unnamed protein product [Callosobruchus maculatus]